MYCFCMQDWITIRGSTSISQFVQSEPFWLDAFGFTDAVFWIDLKEVSLGGATSLNVSFDTSPTKDEGAFIACSGLLGISPGVFTSIPAQIGQFIARWLRWRFYTSGSPTGPWDLTFRLFVALNGRGGAQRGMLQPSTCAPSVPEHLIGGNGGNGGGGPKFQPPPGGGGFRPPPLGGKFRPGGPPGGRPPS